MGATTVGVVFSTSIEVTQLFPQHTDRILLWLAALKNGTTNR